MKKNLLFVFLFTLSSGHLFSQEVVKDTSWKVGGFGSLLINQLAFKNWAAGGENSLSLTALGNIYANYKVGKNFWSNYASVNYGILSSQYIKTVRKNADLVNIGSKAGHDLGNKFFLTGLVDFTTQFAKGYNYPNDTDIVSKAFAPAYLLVSAGIEWRPVDYFSIYLSPATGKFTFVNDVSIADLGTYGNEPAVYDTSTGGPVLIKHGEKVRSEFGAYLMASFQKEIAKNVQLKSKLGLFNNYTDKVESNRKNTDVNFDLLLTMKINSWLAATFFTIIIYDNNIIIYDRDADGNPLPTGGPRTQLSEGFGVGLTYKFGNEIKK